MYQLNDRLLIETYKKAKNLNLNEEFLKLIEEEMQKRHLFELQR